MIKCEHINFSYTNDQNPIKSTGVLKDITCEIKDGSFVLLCGTSGCGKTTLTRLFNGLIPHYYEGVLTGKAEIDGKEYKDLSLFELSEKVGSVFQNPRSQFFNVDTTSEIAFGPENHGMPEQEVLERIEQVATQMNLTRLLGRSIFSLSGGEKQKIACGSAAAINPEVFVFDEPSSNLDTDAINDLRRLMKILKEQGKTVVVAEHRLYYLHDLAEQVIYMKDGRIERNCTMQQFDMISEQEKSDMGLRPFDRKALKNIRHGKSRDMKESYKTKRLDFGYSKQKEILHIEEAEIPAGRITVVIGHNGAGKTTFSRCLCGLERKCKGVFEIDGNTYKGRQKLKHCYMVMQDVNHQLFTESVLDEVLLSMKEKDEKQAELILEKMDLSEYKDCHPMGLSGGQKQRTAIASAIASERPLILFDEPTSGLDLFHMKQVADCVNALADMGKTVVIVTHDPEFILRCGDQAIHLENGRIVESYLLESEDDRERLLDFF